MNSFNLHSQIPNPNATEPYTRTGNSLENSYGDPEPVGFAHEQ